MSTASVGSVVAVATSDTALAIARLTRRSITFYNDDAANPVYIQGSTEHAGAVAATTSHFKLKAGASITLTGRGTFRAIATGASVNVYLMDEFD